MDRTDRITREADAMAELDRYAAQAREAGKTARLGALLIVLLIMAALLAGFNAPRPAHASAVTKTVGLASPVHGKVDVCTTGLAKSWTRKLERKANRTFHQKIDVHRRSEDGLAGCDVVIWRGGHVALDYITGEPSSNPRYHVYTGPYAMATVEINVGTVTPRKARPATIIAALKAAGIR